MIISVLLIPLSSLMLRNINKLVEHTLQGIKLKTQELESTLISLVSLIGLIFQ